MLCEKCQERKATVHILQITSQGKKQLNLCSECAEKYKGSLGKAVNLKVASKEMLEKILGSSGDLYKKAAEEMFKDYKVCLRCGETLAEIKKKGQAGCPDCYNTFSEELGEIVQKVQKANKHKGRMPEKIKEEISLETQIEGLRKEIDKLIQEERYEEAAILRDKIRGLMKDHGLDETK